MGVLLWAAVVGFLAARLVWLGSRAWFAASLFQRANYRERWIPTATGIVVPLTLVVVEAGRAMGAALGAGDRLALDGPRALVLVTALGFGLLGLVDDLAGSGAHRGFRGHLRALASGVFTTGALKLVAGAALALVVVAPVAGGRAPGRLLADAALVALAANLANLLDRAPGRVLKASGVALVLLAVATRGHDALVGTAVAVGAGLGLAPEDLREHLMLGDAGANALGAVLGLGVVLSTAPATRTAVLVGVAAVNVVGEVVSFSRVIAAVPPLRAIDQAGRRP